MKNVNNMTIDNLLYEMEYAAKNYKFITENDSLITWTVEQKNDKEWIWFAPPEFIKDIIQKRLLEALRIQEFSFYI